MRLAAHPIIALGLLSGAVMAQMHPSYTRQGVTFTPSNLFTTPSTNNSLPLVGGMDVFPDGRVAIVEWGVPGSVFIFSGLENGSTGIQAKRFATGLDNAMGLKIVNNVIYVMEKEALTQLVDTDGDGVADEYNSINESFPSDNGMLNFSYDLGYMDGSFYAALSSDVHIGGQDWGSGTYPGTSALAGRSTMYELKMDGTSVPFACGFRNPNGMWTNGSDIFVTDNQGSWLPSSKVINVKKGKFYGHRTNPANACQTSNNNTETPPLLWNNWDNDETGRSSGNGVFLKKGIYANQILVGETVQAHDNKIFRVFVEKVGTELQGVVFPFVKSGVNGVFRIQEADNGDLYLGLAGSSGYWAGRDGMTSGFDVLRANTTVSFDVLAIRSKSNNSFELEFTKTVGSSAGNAANYTINQWQQVPVEAYGGGNRSNSAKLNVTSATISADKKHVTLVISGLQTNRMVKFNFANIVAEDNTALFTNFASYTLNSFGPGTDYKTEVPVPIQSKAAQATHWKIVSGQGSHMLEFYGETSLPHDIALYDVAGKKHLEKRQVSGPAIKLETQGLSKGMYVVRVSGIHGATSAAFMVP